MSWLLRGLGPRPGPHRARRPGLALVVLGGAAIALLTLIPLASDGAVSGAPWWCLPCVDWWEAALNALLYLPAGVGLGLLGVGFGRSAGLLFAASALVELLQRFVIPGRDATPLDVVWNMLGGVAGYLAVAWWVRSGPHTRLSRWLAAAAVAALVFGTGAMVALILSLLAGAPLAPDLARTR